MLNRILCFKISANVIAVILLLTCFNLASVAQTSAVQGPTSNSGALSISKDTSAALQRLFLHKRKVGHRNIVLYGITSAAFGTLLLVQHNSETTLQHVGQGVEIAYLGYSLYTLVKGIVYAKRYSAKREECLLALLQQGKPLPSSIRNEVAKYFIANE